MLIAKEFQLHREWEKQTLFFQGVASALRQWQRGCDGVESGVMCLGVEDDLSEPATLS